MIDVGKRARPRPASRSAEPMRGRESPIRVLNQQLRGLCCQHEQISAAIVIEIAGDNPDESRQQATAKAPALMSTKRDRSFRSSRSEAATSKQIQIAVVIDIGKRDRARRRVS